MSRKPPCPPTLASLASVLPQYGGFTFDRTLAKARQDVGDHPDLADPEHAEHLRIWLNKWLCRIGYPRSGQGDTFVASLATWWHECEATLPPTGTRLARLTDAQIHAVGRAYGDLYLRPAAVSRTGRTRRVGPTAAAKLLYFVRPDAVTAWDRAISIRTAGGNDEAAFLTHLKICRTWAQDLEAEGRQVGLKPGEIGPHLGRPASSVAKLIDEWLYGTITGGFGPTAGEADDCR